MQDIVLKQLIIFEYIFKIQIFNVVHRHGESFLGIK